MIKMEEKSKVKKWLKKNKKKVIAITVLASATIVVIVNQDKIGTYIKTICTKGDFIKSGVEKAPLNKATDTIITEKIINKPIKLSGEYFTATGLGKEVLESNQAINKRLLKFGFMEGRPGMYSLTEKGKQYAIETFKDTRYGHAFSNFEWDKSILKKIFSPEEIAEKEKIKKISKEIIAQYAHS